MSSTTRVNGSDFAVRNSLVSTAQLKAFVIDAGGSLASQTGVDGAIESLLRELQPQMYFIANDTSGALSVIMDGHCQDATALQARIVALGTVNGYSFSSATVALGTSLTVA